MASAALELDEESQFYRKIIRLDAIGHLSQIIESNSSKLTTHKLQDLLLIGDVSETLRHILIRSANFSVDSDGNYFLCEANDGAIERLAGVKDSILGNKKEPDDEENEKEKEAKMKKKRNGTVVTPKIINHLIRSLELLSKESGVVCLEASSKICSLFHILLDADERTRSDPLVVSPSLSSERVCQILSFILSKNVSLANNNDIPLFERMKASRRISIILRIFSMTNLSSFRPLEVDGILVKVLGDKTLISEIVVFACSFPARRSTVRTAGNCSCSCCLNQCAALTVQTKALLRSVQALIEIHGDLLPKSKALLIQLFPSSEQQRRYLTSEVTKST